MALFLVIGPPAAGKSTWVREHAKPGDITIDYDALACTLAVHGDDPHQHPDHVRAVTKAARQAAIDAALAITAADVYVIHSTPSPALLARYQQHGAQVITIDPGYDIVMARCKAERPWRIHQAAKRWYSERTAASERVAGLASARADEVLSAARRAVDAGVAATRPRHSTPGYRRLVAEFRDHCSRHPNPDGTVGAPCWRCHKPIDYSLRPAHGEYIPEAFEADHYHSVKTHPSLMLDPANLRPAHARCNRERGAEDPAKSTWLRAVDW